MEILEIKDKLTMNEIMSLQVTFPFKSFEEVFLPKTPRIGSDYFFSQIFLRR